MSTQPVLQLKDIAYSYTEGSPALRGVSVDIHAGERIAVLGNNGAGKSTFFLCCNGVLQPTEGTLALHGEPVTRKKKDLLRLREAVGLVFQDPDDQIIASTVEAEVSFGPLNLGLADDAALLRVNDALAAMDLEAYRDRPPHYLSGGEKKRVTIADILSMRPSLILFDEPTSSLDPQNTARLQSILAAMSESGVAMMVATHDIDFAYAWASRVLVFHAGRLLADTDPARVFADDALLQTAGLQKPTLYAVAEMLCAEWGVALPQTPPKTVQDMADFMKELKP